MAQEEKFTVEIKARVVMDVRGDHILKAPSIDEAVRIAFDLEKDSYERMGATSFDLQSITVKPKPEPKA